MRAVINLEKYEFLNIFLQQSFCPSDITTILGCNFSIIIIIKDL